MKRILVLTDFSTEADVALRVARDIAKASQADIFFLHVIEPVNGYGYNMTGTQEDGGMDQLFLLKLMETNNKRLNHRANSSEFMGINTHGEIRVGEIFPTIRAFVEEKEIDFVICGSKGTSGMEELIMGSTAERVVRLSPVPVLVVKETVPEFAPKKIVVATNGEESSYKLAAIVRYLADAFGAELHLLNVNTPNNFYRSRTMNELLHKYSETHGLNGASINLYNDSTEEEGIRQFATEIGADLICMGTHGRTGLARILAGSLAEEVVNHSALPVLTCRFDS